MINEAAGHSLLGGSKVLIMGEFSYKEIDWENRDRESWRDKFLQYTHENILYQHLTEHMSHLRFAYFSGQFAFAYVDISM